MPNPKDEAESFAKANKALKAGKEDIAVFWLKKWLAYNAGNRAQLLAFVAKARTAGQFATAATCLKALVEQNPRLEDLAEFAGLKEDQNDHAGALAAYAQMLVIDPNLHQVTARTSLLHAKLGEPEIAMASFRKSLAAGFRDLEIATSLADALWEINPDTAAEPIMTAIELASGLEIVAPAQLAAALRLREWVERRARNLPIYHAGDLDQIPFAFTKADVERVYAAAKRMPHGSNAPAASRLAFAAFAAGDFEAANEAFKAVAQAVPADISAAVHLDDTYLHALRDWDIDGYLAKLPHIKTLRNGEQDKHGDVVFLSCDRAYLLHFGLPLLRSIAQQWPGAQVHLHLMALTAEDEPAALAAVQAVAPLALKITSENVTELPDIARAGGYAAYFHAARFIRFFQFLRQSSNPLWLMDVDALVNADPRAALAALGSNDIGIRIRPARAEPWNQFSACLVAARPTPAARDYFRFVAAYLGRVMTESGWRWGVDQVALFCAYHHLKRSGKLPAFTFFGPAIADVEFLPDGVFWFTAGAKKFAYLKNKTGNPATRFEARFRAFS